MGWNYMSNAIMHQLEKDGILYDASCIPGTQSRLMYGRRDNFSDWSRAPTSPFNPSYVDYQAPGKMKILEIPVTAYEREGVVGDSRNVFPNWMRTVSSLRSLTSFGATISQFPFFSPTRRLMFHSDFLIFSAWRDSGNMRTLLSSKLTESRLNGWAYILGYFHPSELLNPISGKPNLGYLRNLRMALHKIMELNEKLDVMPVTLSEFGHTFQNDFLS
jgi:hypothetical protein